jgi:alkanesulfonate monooxygenase SsuD/methylene tetrahydromethanopterin reductase-like flavin-dependent oxidoreductase (luciferase family)
LLVLEKALRGERFSHQGKFVSVDHVQLNVPPTQPGGPPIYVAILRSEAAYHIGKQGRNLISVPYASAEKFDDIAQLVSEYNRGFSETHPGKKGHAVFAFHTHVAHTDDEARTNAEEAFNLYVRTRLYAKQQTYDDIQQSGLGLFGSPETVAKKIAALKKMGVDHVMLLMNFGLLDQQLVKQSMQLFMEKCAHV